ncbi:MAG TPA: ribonuclease III [Chloroflexota bacterium]|nr:ribonuclease III [Chloroflexota bacterium]
MDESLPVPAEQEPHLAALERRLKVRFRDRGRLFHALVHRSAVNERPDWRLTSNERLEFLGDAVLGVVVAERLFGAYPDASEGVLTVTRASLVCEASLAGWARAVGLGQALVLGRGEEMAGGRDRDALLARTFEAVVGAMYLDRGLKRVAAFLDRFIAPTLTRAEGERMPLDAKSRLQQRGQSERDAVPRYRVVEVTGPQHSPTFTVEVELAGQAVARGSGRSKRAAEQAAAEAALATWDDAPTQIPPAASPAPDDHAPAPGSASER